MKINYNSFEEILSDYEISMPEFWSYITDERTRNEVSLMVLKNDATDLKISNIFPWSGTNHSHHIWLEIFKIHRKMKELFKYKRVSFPFYTMMGGYIKIAEIWKQKEKFQEELL